MGGRIFLATDKDVVWDTAQKVVSLAGRDNGSESVLQVVTASCLQTDPVYVEPGTPEDTTEPVHMSVEGAASVVTRRDINNALDYRGSEGLHRQMLPDLP